MSKVFVKDLDPRLLKQFQAAEASLRTNPQYAADIAAGLLQRHPECTEIRRLLRRGQRAAQGAGSSGGLGKLLGGFGSMLGSSKLAQTNPKEAMENAEKAIAKKVSDIAAHRLLAAAAENLGLFDAAALAYEDIALIEPKSVPNRIALAQAHLKDGNADEALKVIDIALKAFPGNGELMDLSRRASVSKTMDQGKWGSKGGDYRALIKDASEAQRLEQQGRMVNDEESSLENLARVRDQIEADPENVSLYREAVRLCLSMNNTDDALAYLRCARETSLGKADATLEKQETELTLSIYEDRIKALEAELAASPDSAETRAALEEARTAESEYRIHVFKTLVEKYPNDFNYRFEYGVQLLNAGLLDEAVRELQIAQRSPKHRQLAMLNIGRAFTEGRKFDLAVETLAVAKGELPMLNDLKKDVIYSLGLAYEKAGREKEAIDEYKGIYMADSAYRDVAAKINAFYEKK